MELIVRNVNEAYKEGWWKLRTYGVLEQSRNGEVLVMKEPVMTTYRAPTERVLFSATRDANPVFHLMESLWMIAGRHDVESLLPFNSGYGKYAEADGNVHGAYGFRWRFNFAKDQLQEIVAELKRDRDSRRAVLAMWDPFRMDMEGWADTPCNTHIYFDLRGGKLNMTVCCRSNDMLWGAYGANVVHFSILQELIALELGATCGDYRQFSNNFHVYTANAMAKEALENPPYSASDYYSMPHPMTGRTDVIPLLVGNETMEDFTHDCMCYFDHDIESIKTLFMQQVAIPLAGAYLARKAGDVEAHNILLRQVEECDWKLAYREWVGRRKFPQPEEQA